MSHEYIKSLVLTALFAGLAYLSNLALMALPNVTPAYFVVFMAGYILGAKFGFLTGALGFFLISYFSPMGMALLPLLAAQIICGGMVGLCGSCASRISPIKLKSLKSHVSYALWGLIVGLFYMGVISVVDALLFGPFRERFLISIGFSILTISINIVIFVILAPLIKTVKEIVARV